MKKFLAAVMAIAMVLSLVTVPTFADSCTGGEDDYYLHIGAEEIVGRKVTYSGTYNEIDVSMDVTFQGIGAEGDVDNGLYWRSFTGGWGTAYAGYDAKNQQWIIAVGDGASYAGYATAPYVWEAGVEHNLRITHVGKTLTLYVDGVETISSEHDMNISEGDSVYNGSASDGMSGTITSYLSAWDIDNVIYKTMDGTELTNIDFSEADINDLLPDAADGAWYGDKVNGSGSIEFVTLPAPGGEDDYYYHINADETTNFKVPFAGEVNTFDASMDLTFQGVGDTSNVDNPPNGFFWRTDSAGWGTPMMGYDAREQRWIIAVGDGATYAGFGEKAYAWEAGVEHNVRFTVDTANTGKIYVDGEEVLSVTHEMFAEHIFKGAFDPSSDSSKYGATITTYLSAWDIDNVVYKTLDGTELSNIDFSEADIADIFWNEGVDGWFGDKTTATCGSVEFTPAPSGGEDDYYWELSADTGSENGKSNNKIGFDYDEATLDSITNFEVSADIKFTGMPATAKKNQFGFEFEGTNCGLIGINYFPDSQVFSAVYGATDAGSNDWGVGGWPTDTAAFAWAAGEEHNFKMVKAGQNVKFYADGTELLSLDCEYLGELALKNLNFVTRYSYVEVDNFVVKNSDSGNELANIDFSEADAVTALFVPYDGGTQEPGSGAVKFVPAPSTGTPDDYYFNVNAENVVSGNTTHKIGYDYDDATVDSINNWQVTWEIAYLSKADGSSGTRGGFGVQFAETGYGFMDFGYVSGDPQVGGTFGGFQPGQANNFPLFKPLMTPYEWFAGLEAVGLPVETKIRMGLKKEGNTVTLLWADNPLGSNTDDAFNDLKLSKMYFSTVDAYVNLDNIIVKNLDSGTELTNIDFSEANIDELFAPASSWSSSTVGGGSIDYIPGTSTGHKWLDATCTEPRTCAKCGKTAGAALGHDFGEYVYDNNATCTEDGTKTAACSRCDATDTVADADHPAMNHSFTNYVYNEDADCVTDGTMTAKCDRCDVTDTKADPNHTKLGHDFGDAQCGSVATCDRCGEEDPSGAVSHVPDRDAPTCTDPVKCTRANCSLENNIIEVALGHSFTIPATCTTAGKCDRCGSDNPDAPALNHPTTVHNRCTICGHIPGLAEGPKDKMSSNTSDKVLYSNGITGAAYTETDAEYENFTWIMNANIRDFADKDGSYMGLWLCDGFGGRAIYDFKKQQFIISNGSKDLATYDYVWPINDTASVEFAVEKNDKTVTIYVDGEAVATATDDAFAGKRKILHFNDACEMYTDYILIAPVGYLADRNAMRNDIMAKIIFDGMSDACDLSFLSSSSFEVKTMEDNWVRFGYTAGNYNLGDEWDDTSKYTLTMDVIFDNGFIADNQSYGSRFHTFVGNTNGDTGIAVGYSISEGKAYIMDIASKTVFAEKEFAMPMDELVQWAVRVTPEKDDWGDDVTRVELIINGEVVVTYADPSFAHSGDFSNYLAYRIFNTCMKIRGFNVNNAEDVKLITPHAGGTATCIDPAICDECGKAYGSVDANNHQFGEYVSDGNATCTEDGTKTATCSACDATDTIADEGSALDHAFTNYVYDDNATCTDDGTKTAKCDRCDATDTVADPEHPATGHHYGEDGKCVDCGEPAPLQILVGDIDGDGEINAKDATLLKRYLAGWNVEANIRDQSLEILKISADANQDGEVNAKDATLLTRYLASWDVDSAIDTIVIPAQ